MVADGWRMEAEKELEAAQEEEDRTEEAMDSMERKYWEGQVDAIAHLYSLSYALSFAIAARENRDWMDPIDNTAGIWYYTSRHQ